MPTISISPDIEYFYEDSGPLDSGNYTTFVFVHGMGFNGGVYKKLFPICAKHNMRIVTMNRRDYPPSSPFTEAELQLLDQGSTGFTKFWNGIGVNLASFLEKYIEISGVPLPDGEGSGGGVVLVGWSLGIATVHAMLAAVDEFPESTLRVLAKYMKTVVVHDPAPSGLGMGPEDVPGYKMDLWFEPDLTMRFKLFLDSVTGYFEQKDTSFPDSRDVTTLNYNDCAERPHSLSECTPEELEKLTCPNAFGGSDTVVIFVKGNPALYKDMIRRTLFDKSLAAKLPFRVRYYYGGEAGGLFPPGCWLIEKGIKDPALFEGEHARDVKILFTKTGNHFVFWDQPEEFLGTLQRCLE